MHRRRNLILALSAGVLLPRWSAAQQAGVLRIGWLSGDKSANSPFFDAFRGGMRDLGYVEGRNLVIEARFAEGAPERLDSLAAELIQLKPQIIVTQGGPATHPVLRAGATMPVVFGYSGEPDSRDLGLGAVRRARQPADLWPEFAGYLPPARQLCGQDIQRRQARRPPGRTADDGRIGRQSEDRQSARRENSAIGPAARRPGNRMMTKHGN